MDLTRRACLCMAAAGASAAMARTAAPTLILAPSNLGLRPPSPGHEPGAWRAPEVLRQAGLARALRAQRVVALPRPAYSFAAQPGTRIRNGLAIRSFSERLGSVVSGTLARGGWPVVVGGDCSILLGCLLGARSQGPIGLFHIDGHSDFFHPGNYDTASRLGSAAGMDLALATGRGEPLLAQWGGTPFVEDAFAVQIGEREERDPDYAFPDIARTAIRRFPVREVLRDGVAEVVAEALAPVDGERRPMWAHIDLDVLDQRVMPAVDSPGSPGLDFAQLSDLIARLRASGRLLGLDVAIYDPELDPARSLAPAIVDCLRHGLDPGSASSG
jgi:arginase